MRSTPQNQRHSSRFDLMELLSTRKKDFRFTRVCKTNGLERWSLRTARLVYRDRLVSRLGANEDLEKNTRYACHLEFVWWLSNRKGASWTTAQYNLTVGMRGSAIEKAWEDRLTKFGGI